MSLLATHVPRFKLEMPPPGREHQDSIAIKRIATFLVREVPSMPVNWLGAEAAIALGTRMSLLVDLTKTLLTDVRVNLRGREAGVTEKFLDHAKVGPAFEEVRGEGMP